MNNNPRSPIDLRKSIHDFVVAGASNELTEELWTDFEQLLRESDDACRLYAGYVDISVLLPSILSSMPDEASPLPDMFSTEQQEPVIPSIPSFLSATLHGTIEYFSQEVPFSFLMGAVFCGLLVLMLSLIPVSSPMKIANNSPATPAITQRQFTPGPKTEFVGQITGMVDCTWVDDRFAPALNGVALGAKYMLASGLMEITYKTGARVILHGPCTYTVESAAGGFLSLGKLTARVESKSRLPSGTLPTDRDILKSRPAGGTYFAVRTPTAVVTDLGTEFGVEVGKAGETRSVVFDGKVRLTNRLAGHLNNGRLLQAGQAGAVGENGSVVVMPSEPSNRRYVRAMPRPVPVLAYWRFEESASNGPNDINLQTNAIGDASGHRVSLDYWPGGPNGIGPYKAAADVPPPPMFRNGYSGGKKSFNSGALDPHKEGVLFCESVRHGQPFDFYGSFTIEGYFKTNGDQSRAGMMAVVSKGIADSAYLVSVNRQTPGAVQFSVFGFNDGEKEVSATLSDRNYADGRWHYFAARFEGKNTGEAGKVSLLVGDENGLCQSNHLATSEGFMLNRPSDDLFIGRKGHDAARSVGGHFRGLIDEIRISQGAIADEQLLFAPKGGKEVERQAKP